MNATYVRCGIRVESFAALRQAEVTVTPVCGWSLPEIAAHTLPARAHSLRARGPGPGHHKGEVSFQQIALAARPIACCSSIQDLLPRLHKFHPSPIITTPTIESLKS